jgi:ABC-type transport system involved in multi-copper enzyme maturation permease subunit
VKLGDVIAKLDRLQKAKLFKIIASVAVLLIGIGVAIASVIEHRSIPKPQWPEMTEVAPEPEVKPQDGTNPEAKGLTPEQIQTMDIAATRAAITNVLSAQADPTAASVTVSILVGLSLVVIWLGLALTYLALLILAFAVGAVAGFAGYPGFTRLAWGSLALTAGFSTLLVALRGLLSGSHPVIAIARNVVNEAVRMKIFLVFIVVLVLMLAILPEYLSEKTPLRYRVQTVLQFGTGLSFWIIALLVLLLTMSSICFEQRDKVIWQTMTKPVTHAQYLLGKWVGVVCMAGVLLMVCAGGVFMFTEFMRNQRAIGESRAYVSGDDAPISEDRLILETQILTARETKRADEIELDQEKFNRTVLAYIENERKTNPDFARLPDKPEDLDPRMVDKVAADLREQLMTAYRTIEPGSNETYKFSGLQGVRDLNRPLVLKYRVDAGSNRPDQFLKVTFAFSRSSPIVRDVVLGQDMSFNISPNVIDDDGAIYIQVVNGDVFSGVGNDMTLTFPKGGLEVSYPVTSYRANFMRAVAVMWIKLAFLAMVAIFCSTFMSFPVACLVAMGVFFSAETTQFLFDSLESYATEDREGNTVIFKVVISWISYGVAYLFKLYSDLQPVQRLVDGELIPWSSVGLGSGSLALVSAVLYLASVYIFKRRELATYSGN